MSFTSSTVVVFSKMDAQVRCKGCLGGDLCRGVAWNDRATHLEVNFPPGFKFPLRTTTQPIVRGCVAVHCEPRAKILQERAHRTWLSDRDIVPARCVQFSLAEKGIVDVLCADDLFHAAGRLHLGCRAIKGRAGGCTQNMGIVEELEAEDAERSLAVEIRPRGKPSGMLFMPPWSGGTARRGGMVRRWTPFDAYSQTGPPSIPPKQSIPHHPFTRGPGKQAIDVERGSKTLRCAFF